VRCPRVGARCTTPGPVGLRLKRLEDCPRAAWLVDAGLVAVLKVFPVEVLLSQPVSAALILSFQRSSLHASDLVAER
jgi:hypothetical protein